MAKKDKKMRDANDVGGFLKSVEKIGNKMPHPAIIFLFLSIFVVIISHFAAKAGLSVTYFDAKAGEEVTKKAISLLNLEGLRYIFNSATDNFMNFAPIGTVLVAMLGVGVAENSGLFDATLKNLLSDVSPTILTVAVIFAGIMSNIASDAGYVVVVPLGAMIFAAAGRNPLAGIAAAFAGVSGGFSANLLLGTTDPLLTNITNEALKAVGMDLRISATCNFYFLFVSTFLITIVGTLVTTKIVEKNLGKYKGSYKANHEPLTDLEKKGLKNALISLIIFVIIMALLMFPKNAPLKSLDEKTGLINLDEFLAYGLIPAMMLLFLIPGLVYGKTVGSIKTSHDLIDAMSKSMAGMGGFLVLAFFASQFVEYFSKSNLALILAKNGAEFLKSIHLSGLPLLLMFILLTAFLNLFMGSASAKWAIMAPIFVPMMAELGLSPALTQVAYRIGDSSTNIITPLMSYFAMIVVFMQKYDKDAGLGTLTSMMLPYSFAFLISWSGLMVIWYLLGLPLGPGAPLLI